jgi:hypothetical protein
MPKRSATLHRDRRLSAFSLTDLLSLMAIFSLLLGIVAVCLVQSKAKSRLNVCLANVGKVDRAILSYAAENNQTLPGPLPDDNHSVWWWYKEQVKSHAGLTGPSSPNDIVFGCPDDRGYSDPRPFRVTGRFDFSSYVFNGVTLAGMPNIAGLELSAVKQPKRTLLVMEWTAHAPLSWHKSKTGKLNMPFYGDAESVVGFVDGHVTFSKIYYDGYNAAFTQDPINGYEYQYSPN